MKIEAHKQFFLAQNNQWFPDDEFIIHLAEPRCIIKLGTYDPYSAESFESFKHSIVQLEWIDGKPLEYLVDVILKEAWYFFVNEGDIMDSYFDNKATN